MLALKVDRGRKEWNGRPLFSDVSFELFDGEKVALFGKNGIGKTSLISAIMGRVALDEGSIRYGVPLCDWGWLEQDLQVEPGVSLLDFVKSGDAKQSQLALELGRLGTLLAAAANALSPSSTDEQMSSLVDDFAKAQEHYELEGGYAFETQVEMCLTRLQLPKSVWETPYHALSGGQKTRAQLARLMVRKPRALILDEPTNHLDAKTLVWLQDWLGKYEGSVLFVTHDRTLMDEVADAVIELTPNGCRRYRGGYSEFKAARELEIRTQTALYEQQERERRDLQEAITRYQQWYQKAHAAAGERNPYQKKRAMKNATRFKAKERALERLERQSVDLPREAAQAMVEFEAGRFEARVLASLEDVTVAYGQHKVFADVTLSVERGDRIAVLGQNGTGKTTLLKTLTGDVQPGKGQVRRHPELSIGYFEQELRLQDLNQTVLDTLLGLPGMTQSWARTILAGFLFRHEDVFQSIGSLSMGERCRVAFVQLYLSGANLLVLDEPTNYLDVETRERVEEALVNYPGALVLVTHDLYLMRKVANRIIRLDEGRASVFNGSYEEYEQSQATPTYANRDTANQIRQLQLTLTQLMGEEEPEMSADKERLMAEIVRTRQKLSRLEGQSRE